MSMQLRRFTDRKPSPPREHVEILPSAIIGQCRLIPRDSFAYPALLAKGFVALVVEPDFILMRAPEGFEVAQERDGVLPV